MDRPSLRGASQGHVHVGDRNGGTEGQVARGDETVRKGNTADAGATGVVAVDTRVVADEARVIGENRLVRCYRSTRLDYDNINILFYSRNTNLMIIIMGLKSVSASKDVIWDPSHLGTNKFDKLLELIIGPRGKEEIDGNE